MESRLAWKFPLSVSASLYKPSIRGSVISLVFESSSMHVSHRDISLFTRRWSSKSADSNRVTAAFTVSILRFAGALKKSVGWSLRHGQGPEFDLLRIANVS